MSYTKIGWQDEPSTITPINATNLNYMDDEIKSSSDKTDLILGDLASEYSTSQTYAVGDYCIYDSKLYKCTTAIATAEAWTSAHWELTDCGNELKTLNSNLVNKFGASQTITSGNAVPADGIAMFVSVVGTGNGMVNYLINGEIFTSYQNGGSNSSNFKQTFKVKKGDIVSHISVNNSTTTITFKPYI